MSDVYWRYTNASAEDYGARPPERLNLASGQIPAGERVLHGADLQRAALLGRKVTPADCGPVRLISTYGFVVHCPGLVRVWRLADPLRWRSHSAEWSGYGACGVSGDPWPTSESGFLASWLVGTEYAKIVTGVEVLFRPDRLLYQGPLPIEPVRDETGERVEVMAGLEFARADRVEVVDGNRFAVAQLNVIIKLPPHGVTLSIQAGTPLAWFFEAFPRQSQELRRDAS